MSEQAPESFEIIDAFYTDEPVIDRWTVVFNETNPFNGCNTMLATDDTGRGFSQWCEGQYTPDGDNSHLGYQVCLIGGVLLRHVLPHMQQSAVQAMDNMLGITVDSYEPSKIDGYLE